MKRLFSLLFAVLFFTLTLSAHAETTGTISVRVKDDAGHLMMGSWFLHQGTTLSGYLVRNGTQNETFTMPVGEYFLSVESVPGYSAPVISNANPQTLTETDPIAFEVTYPKVTAPAVTDVNAYDAKRVAIAQLAAERAMKTAPSNAKGLPQPSVFIPSSTATSGPTTIVYNPDTSTQDSTSNPAIHLAQTGPELTSFLMLSGLLSFGFLRKRKV